MNEITKKGIQALAEGEFPLENLDLGNNTNKVGRNNIGDELKFLDKFVTLKVLNLEGIGLSANGLKNLS